MPSRRARPEGPGAFKFVRATVQVRAPGRRNHNRRDLRIVGESHKTAGEAPTVRLVTSQHAGDWRTATHRGEDHRPCRQLGAQHPLYARPILLDVAVAKEKDSASTRAAPVELHVSGARITHKAGGKLPILGR